MFWILISGYIILLLFSPYFISNISTDEQFNLSLPNNNEVLLAEKNIKSNFKASSFIFFSYTNTSDSFNFDSLNQFCISAKEITGVANIFAIPELKDLSTEDSFDFQPVFNGKITNTNEIFNTLKKTPLFSKYILSKTKDIYLGYIFLNSKSKTSQTFKQIYALSEEFSNINIFGQELVEWQLRKSVISSFLIISAVSLIVILIFMIILTKSIRAGVLLFLNSFLNAFLTFSFFGIFGISLNIISFIAPILVMALSTTYGIHFYQHYAAQNYDPESAYKHVFWIIIIAGATTILGFLSLAVTSFLMLQKIGIIFSLGILLSMISSLWILPVLLKKSGMSKLKRTYNFARFLKTKTTAIIIIIFTIFVIIFSASISTGIKNPRISSEFTKNSTIYKSLIKQRNVIGGLSNISVFIDFNEEFGFINMEKYAQVKNAISTIESIDKVKYVYSINDYIPWFFGRLSGSSEEIEPTDEYELGETLELLSSRDVQSHIQSYITNDYSKLQMHILIDFQSINLKENPEGITDIIEDIRKILRGYLKDEKILFYGYPVRKLEIMKFIKRNQMRSIMSYFLIVSLIILVITRNIKIYLLSIFPSIIAILTYFGVTGLLKLNSSESLILLFSMVIGVVNDDILCLLLSYRKNMKTLSSKQAMIQAVNINGVSIIFTSLILIAGLFPILLSPFANISNTVLTTIITFIFTTICACVIIPLIIIKFEKHKKKS